MEHWPPARRAYASERTMGPVKLGQQFIARTLLTKKLTNERLPYEIIIPTFQYSNKL